MCLSIPGQVTKICGESPFLEADVRFGNVMKENISLLFCPNTEKGDYVLVHAGSALEIVDEGRAQETVDALYDLARKGRDEELLAELDALYKYRGGKV